MCIEEIRNSDSENQINRANNQTVEVFVHIAQVYRLETNRKNDTMKGVPAGELPNTAYVRYTPYYFPPHIPYCVEYTSI